MQPQPVLKALKRQFDDLLAGIWMKFGEMKFSSQGEEAQFKDKSPFNGTYWMELVDPGMTDDEKNGVRLDMAWLQGVSDATGWELRRPGPREWSPRDKV